MIIYPNENYDSWLSEDDADIYFETRLNADKWDVAASKEAALMTAFRSLRELTLDILFKVDKTFADSYTDIEKAEMLKDLQDAQCEQALHELTHDLDSPPITGLSLGGLLSVKIPDKNQGPPSRYSGRVLSALRPYIVARSMTRIR